MKKLQSNISRNAWYTLTILVMAAVFWTTLVCPAATPRSEPQNQTQRAAQQPPETVKRDVDARIARFKAEFAKMTAKYGENGKLPLNAALRPEVVLPLALTLLDEELTEFGIKRDEQIAAIEAAPGKFRTAVPEHWRKRFLLLTPEQEKRLGESEERKLEKEGKIYHDQADEARVLRIAERLWKQLPEGTPHRIILLRDDEINAACLPNGTICVNSGLLKSITDDDTLAFVLAHECAHYLARHTNESVTKFIITEAGDVLAENKQICMEKEGKIIRPLLLRLGYVGGSIVGAFLPFSRKMESEADALGIRLMARAGFDPQGAIKSFAVSEQNHGAPGWERFLSTHPTDAKRLKHMQKECAKLQRSRQVKK